MQPLLFLLLFLLLRGELMEGTWVKGISIALREEMYRRTLALGAALESAKSVVRGHAAQHGVERVASNNSKVCEQRFEGCDTLLLGLRVPIDFWFGWL